MIMEDKSIHRIGNHRFVDTAVGTYAIQYSDEYSSSDYFNFSSANWDGDPANVNGVRVVPWGKSNNLPKQIRDLLEKNNLGPGILERKTGLL